MLITGRADTMAIHQQDWDHLRDATTEALGSEAARTLMAALEGVPDDVARRADLDRFATKDDLERFATKEDLARALENYPTRAELKAELAQALANYPTKAELKAELAQALTNYPTKDDLARALANHPTRLEWNTRFDAIEQRFVGIDRHLTELHEDMNTGFSEIRTDLREIRRQGIVQTRINLATVAGSITAAIAISTAIAG
jgi:hypothetical protein